MKPVEPPNTLLSGLRLHLARAAWIFLFLVDALVFIVSVPVWKNQMLQDPYQLQAGLKQLGLSIAFFADYVTVLQSILALTLIVITLVIFWRKSDDWMGLLVSIGQLSFLVGVLPGILDLQQANPAWYYPALLVRICGLALVVLVFYLFPDGTFVPSWTSWLWMIYLVYLAAWAIFPSLIPPATPIDIHYPSQAWSVLFILFWFGSGVFAQLYRYRRLSVPLKRQQTRWVVFGFSAVFAGLLLVVLPMILIPSLRSPGTALTIYSLFEVPFIMFAISLLPLSIGISILRYHLWDIDVLIRRTLVYSILTILLGLVYFGGVTILQGVVQAVSGQQSAASIVVSTLVIAALFTPLRRRIQDFIDRRFYRRKYDAERALAIFAAVTRSETDLNKLTDRLTGVVQQTLQPKNTFLWIKTRK